MSKLDQDPIIAFDALFSYPQIQILKIAYPYFPLSMKSAIAIMIKYAELDHTVRISNLTNQYENIATNDTENMDNPIHLLQMIYENATPYLSEDTCKKLYSILSILKSMDQIKQFEPIIDMLMNQNDVEQQTKDFSTILQNYLSDEQLSMFQFFMNQSEENVNE